VRELGLQADGVLWFQVGTNLARFETNGAVSHWGLPVRDWSSVLAVWGRTADSADVLTRGLWLTYEAGRVRTNAVHNSRDPEWFAALPANDFQSLRVGTRDGVLTVPDGTPEPFSSLRGQAVDCLSKDADGSAWANIRGRGIYKNENGRWRRIDLPTPFNTSDFLCELRDKEGAIWIGTRSGLIQLRAPRVELLSRRQGLSSEKVWSICETTVGIVCAGTEDGLSFIHADGKVESFFSSGSGRHSADRLVWPALDGAIYTARNKAGLFKFHDGLLQLAFPFKADANAITCLWGDGNGRLFVGSEKCVFIFNEQKPLPWHKPEDRIEVRKVYCMAADSNGGLWLGTDEHGLHYFHDGRLQSYLSTSNSVWCAARDSSGSLWFGSDKGLMRFKNGAFSPVTVRDGLRENIINSLVLQGDDYLWASGQQGIYRLAIPDLNRICDGAAAFFEPFVIGTADGMETPETNGGKQPASWRTSDNRLWFPTMGGVVNIDPRAVPTNEKPAVVLINQVKADDDIIYGDFAANSTAATGNVQLKPGHGRVIEFSFTANTFLDPKKVRFRYRLVGADRTWRTEKGERNVHYINLRPGDYRFEVVGANAHNTWSVTPASFSFYLAPHFWQTATFYVLCGAALIGLAMGIQAYRLKWQRRLLSIEQQRALASERSRIARDLHDDLGTALTGLALELDVAGREAQNGAPAPQRLRESATRTRGLAERIRQVVWTVNPKCDTVSSLATFLEQQVSQFLASDTVRLRLDFPDEIPATFLGSEARYNIALVVREALTNVIRHARATEVVLSLRVPPQPEEDGAERRLIISVRDNGRGFPGGTADGNGLGNMRERMKKIGGAVNITSQPGQGAEISFSVPLQGLVKV
jgi:signal transduction histidine kinase